MTGKKRTEGGRRFQGFDFFPPTIFLFLVFAMFFVVAMPAPGGIGRTLSVRNFSPEGLVDGPVSIRVIFSSDVVRSSDVGIDLSPKRSPLFFSPTLPGTGRWENPATFVYRPSSGFLSAATAYTVVVDEKLSDLQGNRIKGKREFSMRTSPLKFVGIQQTDFSSGEEFAITYRMDFTLPVSTRRLQGFLSFADKNGRTLPYSISQEGVFKDVFVKVPAGDGSPVSMVLEKGFTSESGPLGTTERVEKKVERNTSMKIRSSQAISEGDGCHIFLETTSMIDFEKAHSFVELSPKGDFSVESWGYSIRITTNHKPRDRVTLTLRKGLPAKNAPALDSDWSRSFIFPDVQPSLSFVSTGRVLSPVGESLPLSFSSVNVEKVNVTINRVYDNNVSFVALESWPHYATALSEMVSEKTYVINGRLNETSTQALDLKKNVAGRKGLFEVLIGTKEGWPYLYRTINVTDIAGSFKLSERGALAWANSIREGKSLTGVKVLVYSKSNQLLAEGTTNTKGIFSITRDEPWEPSLKPDLVVFRKDDDTALLRLDRNIWPEGDARFSGRSYEKGGYQAHCFTPRGVFRPGEKVPIQILLRDRMTAIEEPFPVRLRIVTPTGREWKKTTLMPSKMGMASTVIPLSETATTGQWLAEVLVPGEKKPIGTASFLVEDFAPPRIRLRVQSDKERIVSQGKASLFIGADYLFGAVADGLAYEAEANFIPREYSNPKWPGFVFSDRRFSFEPVSLNLGSGNLSISGDVVLPMRVAPQKSPSLLDIAVKVGVMEDGGRWVYKTHVITYHPYERLLGIRGPGGTLEPKRKTPFEFAALDSKGVPCESASALLSVYRVQRRAIVSRNMGHGTSKLREELLPLKDYVNRKISFKKGLGRFDLVFPGGGEYLVAIKDEESGATASKHLYVYASNWFAGETPAMLPEDLNLELDKKEYRPGDRATVKISGNFAGRVLVTVETDRILHYDTSDIPKEGGVISFPVTEEMLPNAWLTATLVRPAEAEEQWNAHRAFGAVPISLDCSPRKLNVDVSSSGTVKPRAKNEFSLLLKDAKGKPVEGEAVVMLVDEGVLDLTRFATPNPYIFYTSRRALATKAFDAYDDLMPLYLKKTPLLAPGGGDGGEESYMAEAMKKASLSPVHATRFNVLTLWKRVKTDRTGKAAFSFVLPEFSGRVRLMTVAVSRNSFGASEKSFPIARDIVAEISLPRAASPSDSFESSIRLFNMEKKSQDVEVFLHLKGPLSFILQKDNLKISDTKKVSYKTFIGAKNKETVFPLLLKGDGKSGVARVTLLTKYAGQSISQTTELPLRPPFPRVSLGGGMTLKGGQSGKILLPGGWMPGTRRAVLSLSSLPTVELSFAARFLLDYPYHCLEQTVSGGWALLSQPDLVRAIDPRLATRRQLAHALGERIRRIQSLQMYNGGFSFWPGGAADDWSTIYAAHFLVACEKKKVPVPKETLKHAMEYVRHLLSLLPEYQNDAGFASALALRSYASYVLSLKENPPLASMSYLKDNIHLMPEYGRILLAAAYARGGEKAVAREMLGENLPAVDSYRAADVEKRNLDSPIRNQALYLLAWNELDPTSPSAVQSAAALLASLKRAETLTTQEAGFALFCLGDFHSFHQFSEDVALEARDLSGRLLLTASKDVIVSRKIDSGTSLIALQNDGKGTVFAYWMVDGVPLAQPKARDNGLRVRLKLFDSAGKELGEKPSVHRGQKIIGHIFLEPLATLSDNIVVSFPLPGGLEIENPRLMDPSSESIGADHGGIRSELRDDRLLLFIDHLEKKRDWKFSMRAVTAGHFVLPPIAAEGMYSPGTNSVTSASEITVTTN